MVLFICLGECMEFLLTWVIHRLNETGGHAPLLSGKKKVRHRFNKTGGHCPHFKYGGFKHQPSRNLQIFSFSLKFIFLFILFFAQVTTTIGFGSPNKANSYSVHGSALGSKEVEATRANLGWPYEPFHVPEEVKRFALEPMLLSFIFC